MTERWLPIMLATMFWAFSPRLLLAEDCNGNGIADSCDISCSNPGCSGVPGCGQSEDCQPNGIPDECEIAALFAGTKGGGAPGASGGAKVFRYAGGSFWEDISPAPEWDLSAVMALVYFDNHLYVGGQLQHGWGDVNIGQVWRWDGGRNWTQIGGSFSGSVMVLLDHNDDLYAATGAMELGLMGTVTCF